MSGAGRSFTGRWLPPPRLIGTCGVNYLPRLQIETFIITTIIVVFILFSIILIYPLHTGILIATISVGRVLYVSPTED